MKYFFFILSFFMLNAIALAQGKPSEIIVGTNHTINSAVLKEKRVIHIYTPEGYSDSKKEYPVLYILDGQWFFLSGVGIQKALRPPSAIPEMIIVGINTSNSQRRELFNDKSDKFTEFLIDEVVNYIDTNYRTNNHRVIFGWEAAAYFVSELILTERKFNGAIITDGGYAAKDLVKGFTSKENVYLFLANSRKDIYYIGSTDAFYKILKENNPKHLIWKYELFNDEVHETLAHLALHKGLKYYYYNYDSPVFESIQQYIDLGGMDYLNTYFKERAKRFGGADVINDDTKNALIWLAWNRNNFEYFNIFMNDFKDVLKTKRYASAYWQNRFGQFYLKHKDYQNAIKYFETGLSQYPNSNFEVAMKEGLANAKEGKKKKYKS